VERDTDLASKGGTPYRDYEVEFPPLDLLMIEIVATDDVAATYQRLVGVMIVVDLGCAVVMLYGWGATAAEKYLLLTTPLILLIFLGTDLTWVGLAALAFAFVNRGRPAVGGGVLALATLGKIWPVILLPLLVLSGRKRSLVGFISVGLVGGALWLLVGGLDAPFQVITFRGARGWEFESSIGALVWIFTGQAPILEQGSPRVGTSLPWEHLVLGAFLIVGLVVIARSSMGWKGRREGAPAFATVALFLFLTPLFSLEYVGWLVPWAAIAGSEEQGRVSFGFGVAVVVLTGLLAVVYVSYSAPGLVQVLLVVRNALCFGIVAVRLLSNRSSGV
jgi:hypothetical protein